MHCDTCEMDGSERILFRMINAQGPPTISEGRWLFSLLAWQGRPSLDHPCGDEGTQRSLKGQGHEMDWIFVDMHG